MTNEEAVSLLMNISTYDIDNKRGAQKQEALRMAIKALEQQSSEDCISREEAIRVAEQGQIQGYEWQFKKLCTIPSVTPQQTRWIPVKWHIKTEVEEYEQYPEGVVMLDCPMPAEREDVLITIKGKSGQVWVEKDTALKDEDGWYTDGGYEWVDDIIAWMPLPEPYNAESEVNADDNT